MLESELLVDGHRRRYLETYMMHPLFHWRNKTPEHVRDIMNDVIDDGHRCGVAFVPNVGWVLLGKVDAYASTSWVVYVEFPEDLQALFAELDEEASKSDEEAFLECHAIEQTFGTHDPHDGLSQQDYETFRQVLKSLIEDDTHE